MTPRKESLVWSHATDDKRAGRGSITESARPGPYRCQVRANRL